ncbi:hypothetical protein NIIDMKKI_54210 [Mycobacterium kansasii]|uniref:Saccharopine dehydrogenase family protein n=1 Tax=Mycobacterium kansasii TaxID=1768 RepID=A0A7G1IKF6_MYCKA|nr:hypothetical protein NIIDMKKI_54210 [Mycobacterium kansasii]
MILLYGATGYTGRLVARTFAEQGLQPVLSGRREDALRAVADPLGLDVRIGGLDDLDLSATQALLNCAGPLDGPKRRCCAAVWTRAWPILISPARSTSTWQQRPGTTGRAQPASW